jgi:hypothetical protein
MSKALVPATIASVDELPEAAWERLPGETTAAYRFFILYREMDATVRSLRRLGEEHDRSPGGQLKTWAARYFWKARADRWDEYLEQQARDAQIHAVREAAGTRAQVALKGLELIYDRIVGREAEVNEETGEVVRDGVRALNPEMLDAKDLAALGGLFHKLQISAEEHAGEKPLDEQRVRVELAFDLDGPAPQPIIVRAQPSEEAHPRELPPGEPAAAA